MKSFILRSLIPSCLLCLLACTHQVASAEHSTISRSRELLAERKPSDALEQLVKAAAQQNISRTERITIHTLTAEVHRQQMRFREAINELEKSEQLLPAGSRQKLRIIMAMSAIHAASGTAESATAFLRARLAEGKFEPAIRTDISASSAVSVGRFGYG